jgi:plastocyanin
MTHLRKNLLSLVMLVPFVFSSCSKDDVPATTVVNSKVYDLGAEGASGISGTATFIEKSDATLSIELDLKNTPQGKSHPAHIHLNTAAEGGDIALTLNAVDGSTGKSTTTFKTLDDGSAINYQALINFDGYINVHLSADELAKLVAQGDIGQNELTGRKISYVLEEKDVTGINGTVELAERVNQTTLVTIKLVGTSAGESYPAHIHENNVATKGEIIAGLNPVDRTTGISKTQVSVLVEGTSITYTQFLARNAYVNVHLNDGAGLDTIVAQGNIGSSAGGTEAKTYNVTAIGTSSYVFNGQGLTSSNNPNFTFKRGSTYTFNMSTAGHPFYIKTIQGTGTANAYGSGVTNNGAVSGTITFTVPMNAPGTLYYNCQFHGAMTGVITITD